MDPFKIGVLRETKVPPDRRVALPPHRIIELQKHFPKLQIVVQPSDLRCYSNSEYNQLGITLQENLGDCDALIGVKEVDINTLLSDKTYFFFAHVAKEQPYNKPLMQALLHKNIRMVDYEYLTDGTGTRLIAFGRWAGVVGAYNGLRGLGIHSDRFDLKPAHMCKDRKEMEAQLNKVILDKTHILVSGGGRVAQGAMETLKKLTIREVSPKEYLAKTFDEPVICRIDPEHYVARTDGGPFSYKHFFENPKEYKSTAKPYLTKTDLYVAAHYWNPDSPRMFEIDNNQPTQDDFQPPKVIADVSCDIDGSVPTTTHATTIANPFYWYDDILMMTVDNLPGELPRDASDDFSKILAEQIIPKLLKDDPEGVIKRATITEDGELTKAFDYLKDYATK